MRRKLKLLTNQVASPERTVISSNYVRKIVLPPQGVSVVRLFDVLDVKINGSARVGFEGAIRRAVTVTGSNRRAQHRDVTSRSSCNSCLWYGY
jgi:hypothetical protein